MYLASHWLCGEGVGSFLQPLPLVPEPWPTIEAQRLSGRAWGPPALPSLCPVFPQSYLHTFAYQSTTYLDLWEHLQKVSSSQPPLKPFPWGLALLEVPGGSTCM